MTESAESNDMKKPLIATPPHGAYVKSDRVPVMIPRSVNFKLAKFRAFLASQRLM